jgi:hypothetical protein
VTLTILDADSGNEISGLTLENDVTFVDTISACGGALASITADPQLYDQFSGNGIDCVTSERIHYADTPGQSVSAPSTALSATRDATFWFEAMDASPGTQWQTHDPVFGARVGLASGQPLFMSANNSYLPPGAGSSFYRQLCTYTGADYTLVTKFVATANTDTLLATYFRYVDANNNLRIEYVPATTTWNLTERIAGVDNILATANHDLTADGIGGAEFDIQLTGVNITIFGPSPVLGGAYVTAHTAAGPFAFFITATGANASGFGGTAGANLSGSH